MTATQPQVKTLRTARKNQLPSRVFLLIAPLLYAAYALLTPPFQTPDEHQHLFRAWQLSEFHLFGERRADIAGGTLPEGLGRAALPELGTIEPHATRPVLKRPVETIFTRATPPDTEAPPRFFNFVGSVMYSPAGYVPQVAAIWVGKATGLSVENIVRFGRLLNAALTIFLIYYAIRLATVGALALVWVGLLPMTGSASAAFGQDGLIIGGACLLTTIGLRVVLNGHWQRSDLLIAGGLTISMTLSKLLYFPIAMVGGQPAPNNRMQWHRLLKPLLICVVAAAITALWIQAVSNLVMPPQADIPPAGERLADWFYHPTQLLALLKRTYIDHGVHLFDTLFTFGWLNIGPVRSAAFLSLAGLGVVLVAGDAAADRLTYKTRLWLLAIAASIALLMSATLYLYWTPASDTWIQGLQGRYFIPIAPLFLMAFLPKRDGNLQYGVLIALLMLGANLLSLGTIVRAFYSI
jgi:uncharacterized membrane protein